MTTLGCIYCSKPGPWSESHIIPEALGAGPTLKTGVCKKCNNDVNQRIEQIAQERLSLIRNFLDLPGKHTATSPAIEIQVELRDLAGRIRMRKPSDLDAARLVLKDQSGELGQPSRIAFLASTAEDLDAATAAFRLKHPSAAADILAEAELDEHLKYRVIFDAGFLADSRCLRLAAKIALEWWCLRRGHGAVMGSDYADIKSYVLTGAVTGPPPVSIVSNPGILGLIAAPFGIHSIVVTNDPRFRDLIVYVGLFSFVHYKVALSRRFTSLARTEDVHLLHPQTGEIYRPVIRRPLRRAPDLAAPHPSDLIDPLIAIRGMETRLLAVLNNAFGRAATSSH